MTDHALRVSATTRVVVADVESRTLADIEHLVHVMDAVLAARVDESSYVVSTHAVAEPRPHFAAVASWVGGAARDELAHALAAAIDDVRVLALGPRVAVLGDVAAVPGPQGVEAAVSEHASRDRGRLARYPGRTAIERRLTAGEVVALSCVEEVVGLAGTEVRPDSVVDLTGFARPEWRSGRCVLLVQPGATALLPFEAGRQIPCCSDH